MEEKQQVLASRPLPQTCRLEPQSTPSPRREPGAMFGKKKKRVEISAPSNFEHRVHTGFDQHEQKFTGLPRQWQSLIEESARRPKPLIDPACITSIQPGAPKVCRRPPLPLLTCADPRGVTPALSPTFDPPLLTTKQTHRNHTPHPHLPLTHPPLIPHLAPAPTHLPFPRSPR